MERYTIDYRIQEPRDEYDILPEEYEEAYGVQFTFDRPQIIFTKPRVVSEPINYYESEYYWDVEIYRKTIYSEKPINMFDVGNIAARANSENIVFRVNSGSTLLGQGIFPVSC